MLVECRDLKQREDQQEVQQQQQQHQQSLLRHKAGSSAVWNMFQDGHHHGIPSTLLPIYLIIKFYLGALVTIDAVFSARRN